VHLAVVGAQCCLDHLAFDVRDGRGQLVLGAPVPRQFPDEGAGERCITSSFLMATPADSDTSKEYRLGILMVHGIGTQARRGTLVAWGDVLLSVIRRASGGSATPTVEQAWGGDTLGDVPAKAVVTIRSGGGKESWLLEESWWADTFPAPTYSELVSWSLRALPWSVCLHIAQRYWQTASKDAGINWAAAGIALAQFAVAFVVAPFFLVLLAAVLLLGLLPIPQLRTFALTVQSTLTATIGDSLAFVESPIRAALIRTRILAGLDRLKSQCDRTIVVAHSQGAAAVLDALGGFAETPAGNTTTASDASASPGVMPDALFTFGAGINQLASLRVLSRGLSKDMPFNPAAGAVWAFIGGLVLSGWLYVNVKTHQISLRDLLIAVGIFLASTLALSVVAGASLMIVRAAEARSAAARRRIQQIGAWFVVGLFVAGAIGLFAFADNSSAPIEAVFCLVLAIFLLLTSIVSILSKDTKAVVTAEVAAPAGLEQWVDLYSSADPVPNGETRISDTKTTAVKSRRAWNGGSMLSDHTSYWENLDGFVLPLVLVCADIAESPWLSSLPPDSDSAGLRARARWRVSFLRWGRWLNALVWLGILAVAAPKYATRVPLPFATPTWLPASGAVSARLLTLTALVAAAGSCSYVLMRWAWRLWVRAEQEQVLKHERPTGWPWAPTIKMGIVLAVSLVALRLIQNPTPLPPTPTSVAGWLQFARNYSEFAYTFMSFGMFFAGVARVVWREPKWSDEDVTATAARAN
jgi:hypothetical protein